jgi:hypothetical protein
MILSGHYISKRFPAFALEKSLIIMWLINPFLESVGFSALLTAAPDVVLLRVTQRAVAT